MVPPNQDERSLVDRAVAGDTDAFGELYSQNLDAIYRYIYYRTGHQQDAEDLTEHVFIKAWEALPGYRDFGHPFKSWLYRIAHNVVIDHHRRQRTQSESIQEVYVELREQSPATALSEVIRNEDMAKLTHAILSLSSEQQQVIVLRFIEDLSHAEIAHILGKNEGSCRMIQHRALAALNNLLSSE